MMATLLGRTAQFSDAGVYASALCAFFLLYVLLPTSEAAASTQQQLIRRRFRALTGNWHKNLNIAGGWDVWARL